MLQATGDRDGRPGLAGTRYLTPDVTAGLVGPFTAAGNAAAGDTYTDRPTVVVYQPVTGFDFSTRLMTPILPSSVLFSRASGLLCRAYYAELAGFG